MINRVEAIVDAISKLNGCSNNPESDSYQLRNPLMVRSFARPGKHEVNNDGVRAFSSLLAGYKAGVFDMTLKLSGKSRAGLKPEDTLENLLGCYGIHGKAATDNIVSWLRRSLKDDSISARTELSFFLENK